MVTPQGPAPYAEFCLLERPGKTAVNGRCVDRINCADVVVPVTRPVEVDGVTLLGTCSLQTLDEMYTIVDGFNACVLDWVDGMHSCAQNNFDGILLPEWEMDADKVSLRNSHPRNTQYTI